MNEDLKTKLLEYLDKLDSGVKTATDFSVEQAPLVIKEYLDWIFWFNTTWGLVWLTICMVIILAAATVVKLALKDEEYGAAALITLMTAVVLIIPIYWTIAYTLEAIQVVIAPRIVLLEKISELIK
jgi:hypothetical protein